MCFTGRYDIIRLVLRRILRRFKMILRNLEVMFARHPLRIADPVSNNVQRKGCGQFRFPTGGEDSETVEAGESNRLNK